MDDDYIEDDYESPCSKCGHVFTRRSDCTNYCCEDGQIDLYEYDDPINFSPGEYETCPQCGGAGRLHWCPNCGWDFGLRCWMNGKPQARLLSEWLVFYYPTTEG